MFNKSILGKIDQIIFNQAIFSQILRLLKIKLVHKPIINL